MSDSRTFVTLFPSCRNIELVKDVGMIPYMLQCKYGYISSVACYDNDQEYFYLKNEVQGLSLDFIKKVTGITLIDMACYLWKNSFKIDVLNLYHFKIRNIPLSIVYKRRNKKGKIYLKLDVDLRGLQSIKKESWLRIFLRRKNIELADYVSAESRLMCREIESIFNKKIYYIPDGFLSDVTNEVSLKKEDIILTVGRLGTEQKATEILMEAFRRTAASHSWTLMLVGGVESAFIKYCNKFFLDYPEMKERIYFEGKINDRMQLANYYKKAKVFALPSRWESFGIVLAEALSYGCFLITTEAVPSAPDLTKDGEYGRVISHAEVEKLSEVIQIVCNNYNDLGIDIEKISRYAYDNFEWNKITEDIDDIIKKLS